MFHLITSHRVVKTADVGILIKRFLYVWGSVGIPKNSMRSTFDL